MVFQRIHRFFKNNLGSKKIVRLATHEKLILSENKGISHINQISQYESELEVDTSLLSLDQFMKQVNNNRIRDISISEPPIEKVIKKLYQ